MSEDGKPSLLLDRWRLLGAALNDPRTRDSTAAIAVLWTILERINRDTGEAFPSLSRLSKDTGRARSSVQSAIDLLERCGYVVRISGDRTQANRYRQGTPSDTGIPADRPTPVDRPTPASRSTPVRRGTPVHRSEVDRPAGFGVDRPTGNQPAFKSNPLKEPTKSLVRFGEFWSEYPRKVARATAEKAWKRHALDKLADQILQDVRARCGDPQQWTDAQFIPHPSTYLNQRRWEDDPSVAAPNHGGNVIDADFGRLPRETQEAADAINAASAKRLGIKP